MPHILARLAQFVQDKRACRLVNKTWNVIFGKESYREELEMIDTDPEYGLNLDDIVQTLQQSLLNRHFQSGLAHVLRRKDISIGFSKLYNGAFPMHSIAQLNALLNPNITNYEFAAARVALTLDDTYRATFQNGVLRSFELYVSEYASAEQTRQLIIVLESIIDLLPNVSLQINLDYRSEFGIPAQLIGLCQNNIIAKVIQPIEALDVSNLYAEEEDIRCVLETIQPRSILIRTEMGIAGFNALLPHHVNGTDMMIFIHRLDDVPVLDAFLDLLSRLDGAEFSSLWIRVVYDTGSLSNWLDAMWQRATVLPSRFTVTAFQDQDYYSDKELLVPLIRSQIDYKLAIEAFNLRQLDSESSGKHEIQIESSFPPIEYGTG